MWLWTPGHGYDAKPELIFLWPALDSPRKPRGCGQWEFSAVSPPLASPTHRCSENMCPSLRAENSPTQLLFTGVKDVPLKAPSISQKDQQEGMGLPHSPHHFCFSYFLVVKTKYPIPRVKGGKVYLPHSSVTDKSAHLNFASLLKDLI